jgi:hypothetical protein
MKTLLKKDYMTYMQTKYPDYEDKNDFYHVALITFKGLQRSDKDYSLDIASLTELDKAGRLNYRRMKAEEGREFTPLQVDQLIDSINYAKDMVETL